MEEIRQQERYDSFDEYNYNYDIYNEIKRDIEDLYDSFPYSVLGELKEHKESITKDCLRLRKYLLKFGSKEECQKKNCCAYINYLLNDEIRNSYESKKYIFEFYTKYLDDHSNQDIKKLCKYEINDMEEDKYQKTKKLYNVYVLYKFFISNKQLTLLACSRANSCATAYNNIIAEYPNLNDTKFCKALRNFKKDFEYNTNISTKQCDALYPNIFLLQDTCINLQEQSIVTDLSTQQQAGQVNRGEQSMIQSFPPALLTERGVEEQSSSPSSSGSTLPIAFFSSGIGALLILLSFYKFTPFGQFIKLKMQKFKGTSDHLDGEQYEMQQHNSKYEKRNAEDNVYNISYSSL
ncbi:PIR protein [Plasmodium ovale]|uniref:PIR Superfamily Protein n=2 Tax=Plasmodium ovale TaxID=36330 RepID=A0A1A8WHD3_PLAOA|nr:PIR Superfamily Protein [Plasmodium ovale curtisi]SBT00887.1 PIR Superfamily Protein [Plasmodium ovale curtisi]SBT83967.1 PIR protein [Plasmodium ovale]